MLTTPAGGMRERTLPIIVLALFSMADVRLLSRVGGLPSFTLTEIVSLAVIALVFMDAVIYPAAISTAIRRALTLNPPLSVFFVWAAVAAFSKAMLGEGFFGVASFKDMLPSALLLISLTVYVSNESAFATLWKCLLVGIAANVVLGLSQAFVGAPFPVEQSAGVHAKLGLDGTRFVGLLPSGWFTHPNAFAVFLVPCLALLLPVALGRAEFPVVWRVLSIFGMPLVAFCLYKTQGKGAMFWAAFGCLVTFAAPLAKKRAAVIALFVLPAAIGILIYATMELAAINRTYSTMSTRVDLWRAGLVAVSEGWASFTFGSSPLRMLELSYESTRGHFPYANAHNGLLNVALNYGVPAALFYLAAVVVSFRQLGAVLSPHSSTPPVFRALAGAILGAVMALVGESFFEPSTDGVVLQCQFFILLIMSGLLADFARKRLSHSNG